MSIGIKVSKVGFDVKTADDRNLSFSTKYSHPQVFKSGKIVGTADQFIHGLGFPPTTAGYIITNNKHFVQYDLNPFVTENFENSDYGTIRTDSNNVFLTSDSPSKLAYIIFANPAQAFSQLKGGRKVRDSKAGLELSVEGASIRQVGEEKVSLTTHFETFSIVDVREITITTAPISQTDTPVSNSTFVDIPHNLGYAAHIILINEFEGSGVAYVPITTGFEAGSCYTNTEIYIDSKKLRFRVSRNAKGSNFPLEASCPAGSFKFKYYLTNYKLPE